MRAECGASNNNKNKSTQTVQTSAKMSPDDFENLSETSLSKDTSRIKF